MRSKSGEEIHTHIAGYVVEYDLESGRLWFFHKECLLVIGAPPEFRALMEGQKSLVDQILVLETSTMIQAMIDTLETKLVGP